MTCDSRIEFANFLTKVGIEPFGVLCPSYRKFGFLIEFDPFEESDEVILNWLAYRGLQPVRNFRDQAINDMKKNGNHPSFGNFIDFDVQKVSDQFLLRWLSWYGVTTLTPKPREWFVKRVDFIKTIKKKKKTKIYDTIKSFSYKNQKSIYYDNIKRHHNIQKTIRRINTHLAHLSFCVRDLKIIRLKKKRNQLLWRAKKFLAFALNGAAVSFPFYFKHQIKKDDQRKIINFVTPKVSVPNTAFIKITQQLLKTYKNDRFNDMISYGTTLYNDVLSLAKGSNFIPVNILKKIAKDYMYAHPTILDIIINVAIPIVDVALKTK